MGTAVQCEQILQNCQRSLAESLAEIRPTITTRPTPSMGGSRGHLDDPRGRPCWGWRPPPRPLDDLRLETWQPSPNCWRRGSRRPGPPDTPPAPPCPPDHLDDLRGHLRATTRQRGTLVSLDDLRGGLAGDDRPQTSSTPPGWSPRRPTTSRPSSTTPPDWRSSPRGLGKMHPRHRARRPTRCWWGADTQTSGARYPRLRLATPRQMEPVERDDVQYVGETSGARRPGAVADTTTTTTTRWSPTTPRWRSSSATTCSGWRLTSRRSGETTSIDPPGPATGEGDIWSTATPARRPTGGAVVRGSLPPERLDGRQRPRSIFGRHTTIFRKPFTSW